MLMGFYGLYGPYLYDYHLNYPTQECVIINSNQCDQFVWQPEYVCEYVLAYIQSYCSPSWELELRPLGVATGNALSVTRSEDTYEKTPPVGRRQPMTSLPAYHNISAAGRIHHQLFRLH